VVAVLLTCAFGIAGCSASSIDPSESTFYVKIANDTSRTVVLSFCGTDQDLCDGKTYDTGVLKPGASLPTVQTSVGLSNPELVRSRAGQRLGCLPLLFDYNASGAVVWVSQLVPCRKRYAAQAAPPARDPPLFVMWNRIGDIALGESKMRVEAEYGSAGHGFHVIQRYGNSVQGRYRLHDSDVVVTFQRDLVNDIDFVTPYYRTKTGFGIRSAIPPGRCHNRGGGCEHRWHGFVLYPKWKDSPCNCWIKVGTAARSAIASPRNFLKPWFFIFTRHGRAAEIFLSRRYID
jgi:hypothetical protein